eukprot:m.919325 g.919325  ORF g.919325 m.919325 type:complete len:1400 (-) comp23750_c0_seq1:123-4322(-)
MEQEHTQNTIPDINEVQHKECKNPTEADQKSADFTVPDATASESSNATKIDVASTKSWILQYAQEYSSDEDDFEMENLNDAAPARPPTEEYLHLHRILATFQAQAKAAKAAGDKGAQKDAGKQIGAVRRSMAGLEQQHGKEMLMKLVAEAPEEDPGRNESTVDPSTSATRSTTSNGWGRDFLVEPGCNPATAHACMSDAFPKCRGPSESTCADSDDSDAGGFDGSCLFDLSMEEPTDSATPVSTVAPHNTEAAQYNMSKWPTSFAVAGWTGPPPRQLLGEVLRRAHKQAPAPKFTKSGCPGRFRSTVKTSTMGLGSSDVLELTTPTGVVLATAEEAHSLAATLALFALAPDQPLHLRLPLPFRQVWTALQDAAMEDRRVVLQASTARRDAFVAKVVAAGESSLALSSSDHRPPLDQRTVGGAQDTTDLPTRTDVVSPSTDPGNPPGTNTCIEGSGDASDGAGGPLDAWEQPKDSWEQLSSGGDIDTDPQPESAEDHSAFCESMTADTVSSQPQTRLPSESDGSHHTHNAPSLASLRQILHTSAQSKQGTLLRKACRELPANQCRQEILDMIASNKVAIVGGETGCGKSTQVPKMILEDALAASPIAGVPDDNHHALCNIICTQPRRISAMSIAERVSSELGQGAPGSRNTLVGYQVRMDTKTSPVTRLVYCTTGILLRRLQSDASLEGVTHVVIDEVHERSRDSDFLLLLLRRAMRLRTAHFRVVLMSATMETQKFTEYFDGCPSLAVPGRTFPVTELFLEDVVEATGYTLDSESRYYTGNTADNDGDSAGKVEDLFAADGSAGRKATRSHLKNRLAADASVVSTGAVVGSGQKTCSAGSLMSRYTPTTAETLRHMRTDMVNFDVIETLLLTVIDNAAPGAVLVFLPGMGDIRSLYTQLTSNEHIYKSDRFLIIPLHSTVSPKEQAKAFITPPTGVRKVVLSTNIAETGITIPDCVYVIDSTRVKETRYRTEGKLQCLVETNISKASAKQRAGRAGRVQPGTCYRLVTRRHFASFHDYTVPELRRVPLESVVLHLMAFEHLGNGDGPTQILQEALDPPTEEAVVAAVDSLREIGAIARIEDPENEGAGTEYVTSLGHHLARMPMDSRLGKMMIYGAILGVAEATCTIAAAISFKSPLAAPFGQREAAGRAHRALGEGTNSDLLTILRAHDRWRRELERGGGRGGAAFCRQFHLDATTLHTIHDLREDFLKILRTAGFDDMGDGGKPQPTPVEHQMKERAPNKTHNLLRAAIVAGLYPHIGVIEQGAFVMNVAKGPAVRIHPSSVVDIAKFNDARTAPTIAAYVSTLQTNRIYAHDVSIVSPIPVLLFGGVIGVRHRDSIVTVDKRIYMSASPKTAVIFKTLRRELDAILNQKIVDPKLDLVSVKLVQDVIELIECSGCS